MCVCQLVFFAHTHTCCDFTTIPLPLSDCQAKSKTHVKTDWGRYVDEDEEKEGFDTGAMGPGAMVMG